jgi:hypothetical protein
MAMKAHLTCWIAIFALATSGSAYAAVNFAVDINSTRLGSSDISGTLVTQPGFTPWDLTTVGTSGSTLALDGITFEIFGLAAANQSRVRTAGGGGGPYNALLADFVYNEGAAGRAVGLRITGLPIGTYSMQSWHYDASVMSTENYIQIEVRNQGGTATVLVDNRPFGTEPAAFSFDVTEAGQVKEVIFREDDAATATDPTDSNRARLNGFTLTPEPASLSLLVLAGCFSLRRRR